ncbi:MAG TPA: hypothetical protein VES01_05360 [Dermatophilaceae bacterium]|nr:hypothetical protein [Dermatophilaceae bacterium]
MGEPSRDLPWFMVFVIPELLKGECLELLERAYGKTRAALFPDLSGFVDAFHRGLADMPKYEE